MYISPDPEGFHPRSKNGPLAIPWKKKTVLVKKYTRIVYI